MITVDYYRPVLCNGTDNIHTVFSSPRLVAKIGEELQSLYGEMTRGAQPCHLLALANRIDATRDAHDSEG